MTPSMQIPLTLKFPTLYFTGLQSNNSDVWKLFAAVSIHATAILFCIGTEMIAMGTKKLQVNIVNFDPAKHTQEIRGKN